MIGRLGLAPSDAARANEPGRAGLRVTSEKVVGGPIHVLFRPSRLRWDGYGIAHGRLPKVDVGLVRQATLWNRAFYLLLEAKAWPWVAKLEHAEGGACTSVPSASEAQSSLRTLEFRLHSFPQHG